MLKPYLDTFLRYKYLLVCLVDRDYKVKYRRSVFGILWSMLNPIMMMIILNAVFSRVFRADIENFPVYLLTGQLVFSFFNEASSSAIFSVVEASALIKKIYVPKYVFPLERVLFGFVNMVFSLSALIILMIVQKVQVTAVTLLFPLPLIALFLFTCGWSFLISALCVYFRDLKHLYSVLMTAWMYITPIMYPIEYLSGSWVYKIVMLNPLTWYVQYFRQIVMYHALPTLEMNIVCFGEAILMMIIGLLSFRKLQDKFILHI
ncbi:MAG: ABC transporter permease [Oscillospiraceae bacterium]|nr:ABC transporter permease [Oscillospiraceae bacterium]MDO5137622.1 ABC transporter permease [Oscillospiraceae bacterium]